MSDSYNHTFDLYPYDYMPDSLKMFMLVMGCVLMV